MTTLIAVYTSSGCVGRCDAKCYEATTPHCECICGGINHGAGRNQAITNTVELAQKWIDEHQAQHPEKQYRYDVPKGEAQQLEMDLTYA